MRHVLSHVLHYTTVRIRGERGSLVAHQAINDVGQPLGGSLTPLSHSKFPDQSRPSEGVRRPEDARIVRFPLPSDIPIATFQAARCVEKTRLVLPLLCRLAHKKAEGSSEGQLRRRGKKTSSKSMHSCIVRLPELQGSPSLGRRATRREPAQKHATSSKR